MVRMVRKVNLEHLVLLASLVPMVLTESLARRETPVHLATLDPRDHKVNPYMHVYM